MTTAELELAEPPEPPAAPEERRRASDAPLHAGTDPPLAPAEIARWIAPQIAERIERAAWWPEHTLRENWKLGDYSAYVVAFPAPGFKKLQVRFVSEPDATALLEVSTTGNELRFRNIAPDALRAALAAAGFRAGGSRAGYVKPVLVESREDCEALAAEIAGRADARPVRKATGHAAISNSRRLQITPLLKAGGRYSYLGLCRSAIIQVFET